MLAPPSDAALFRSLSSDVGGPTELQVRQEGANSGLTVLFPGAWNVLENYWLADLPLEAVLFLCTRADRLLD